MSRHFESPRKFCSRTRIVQSTTSDHNFAHRKSPLRCQMQNQNQNQSRKLCSMIRLLPPNTKHFSWSDEHCNRNCSHSHIQCLRRRRKRNLDYLNRKKERKSQRKLKRIRHYLEPRGTRSCSIIYTKRRHVSCWGNIYQGKYMIVCNHSSRTVIPKT
jgi:hypothetical protein